MRAYLEWFLCSFWALDNSHNTEVAGSINVSAASPAVGGRLRKSSSVGLTVSYSVH